MRLLKPFLFLCRKGRSAESTLSDGSLLLDSGSLTGELAQIIEFGTTHLTALVDLDRGNVRGIHGEDTLHTNRARHLAHRETLLVAVTTDLDDYTAIELNALLGTFDDFVTYCNRVACLKFGKLITGCKCFFSNFN